MPACTVNATAYRRRQMRDARNAVRLFAQARIGVEFWDFRHNQTGVAPNAIELHLILAFRVPQLDTKTTAAGDPALSVRWR